MKFQFSSEQRQAYRVNTMCRVLDVSECGYSAWLKRPKSLRQQKNEEGVERRKEIHQSNRRVYGSPRSHAELKTPGGACSRKRIARLMQTHGISAKIRRRRVQTTESRQTNPIAENRRDRDFLATEPHRTWLTDRTAMRTAEGWLSLAVVLDLYSRLVVGWSRSIHRDARLVENALHMALARRHPPGGLVHHSDRGSHYTSQQSQEQLAQAGIEVSMSRKGNCWENAPMESFCGNAQDRMGRSAELWQVRGSKAIDL